MPPFCGNNTLQQILNLMTAKLTILADKEVDLTPILDALTTVDGNTTGLATIINGVQSSINSANSSLGTITTNTGSALSKLDTLQTDVTTVKTYANTINTNVNTANSTLNSNTTRLTTIDNNTMGLAAAVNGVQSSVNSANSSLGIITTNTGSALTKLDTIQAAIDALNGGGGTITVKAAIVWDEKAATTSGGTFTNGAWRQRTLNAKLDPDSIVTLATNMVTVGAAGSYLIRASAPAYGTNMHQTRLMKNGVLAATGSISHATPSQSDSRSVVTWVGSCNANDAFTLEHRCNTTVSINGMGVGDSWGVMVFTIMEVIQWT